MTTVHENRTIVSHTTASSDQASCMSSASSDSGYLTNDEEEGEDVDDMVYKLYDGPSSDAFSYLDDLFLSSPVPSGDTHGNINRYRSNSTTSSNNVFLSSNSRDVNDVSGFYEAEIEANHDLEFTVTPRTKGRNSSSKNSSNSLYLSVINNSNSDVYDDISQQQSNISNDPNSNQEQELEQDMKTIESYLKHHHNMRQTEDKNRDDHSIFTCNPIKLEDHRLYYHTNFANPIAMKQTFLYCLQTDDVDLTKDILRDVGVEYLMRHCMLYHGFCDESVAVAFNGAMDRQLSSLSSLNNFDNPNNQNNKMDSLDQNGSAIDTSANMFWLASLYGSAQVLDIILEATWVHLAESHVNINDVKYQQEHEIDYEQIELNSKNELTKILNESSTSCYGITPLSIAAAKNHKDVILTLLKYGVDPNQANESFGTTPALIAAARNNTEALEGLTTSITDFNKKNDRDITPLLAACRSGSINSVRYLTNLRKEGSNEQLVDCRCQNSLGYGCASVAVQHNQRDVIIYLCQIHDPDHGVDINQKNSDKDGDIAIHVAVKFNRTSIVKSFLEMIPRTCDILAVNNLGMTALHMAANMGNSQIVNDLIQCLPLEAFVKFDVEDVFGMTPIFYACLRGFEKIVKLLAPLSDINTLRRVQMVTKQKTRGSKSRKGRVDDNKQSSKKKIYTHQTPLHAAASYGSVDIIYTLIHCGSDVNQIDSRGHTALSLASKTGHLDAVKILVENGADMKIKSKRGKNPLQKAKKYKRHDIVAFFEHSYGK